MQNGRLPELRWDSLNVAHLSRKEEHRRFDVGSLVLSDTS